jgi:hypothetical protein
MSPVSFGVRLYSSISVLIVPAAVFVPGESPIVKGHRALFSNVRALIIIVRVVYESIVFFRNYCEWHVVAAKVPARCE